MEMEMVMVMMVEDPLPSIGDSNHATDSYVPIVGMRMVMVTMMMVMRIFTSNVPVINNHEVEQTEIAIDE